MDGILLTARLLLVAVFLVAGLAKLADREGAREATHAFGVPEALAGAASALLIAAELAAAGLLLPSATARIGAVLGAMLLVIFCAGITRSMRRGEAPDCHCFGQLHSAPAGPKTLVRNTVLAEIAIVVIVGGPGTSATAWIGRLSDTAAIALGAAVALGALLVAAGAVIMSVLKRHGELLLRIDALEDALTSHGIEIPSLQTGPGLPVGGEAPDFEVHDLEGERVTLTDLTAAGRPLLLVFTDPACGPCSALMPQLAAWQHEHEESLLVALISRGDRDANLAHAHEHRLTHLLLQRDRELDERYGVQGTPSAVLIDRDGTIASPVHAGAEEITALVNAQVGAPVLAIHQHEPAPSGPAPDLPLRTLRGAKAMLSSRLSGRTVVLFWNPSCGFCERMLPDLLAFEADPPPDSPRLLVISTGLAAANRAMGVKSPILLDDSFSAGSAFGATGTPSAVLVDEDGQIASHVAVGADAVLALLGSDAQLRAA